MGKTKNVLRLVKRVPELLPSVGLVPAFSAILLMILIIFFGVFTRYVLGNPLPFVDEYSGFLLALIIFLGLAYALKTKGHVSVDIVIKMLPHRITAYLEAANLIVALGFVILILIATTQLTTDSFAEGKLAWGSMETPLGPVQLVMPIGLSLFVIGLIAAIASKISSLRAPKGKG